MSGQPSKSPAASPSTHLSQLPDAELDIAPQLSVPLTTRRLLPKFRRKDESDPDSNSWLESGGNSQQGTDANIDFGMYKLPPAVDNAKKGWENSLSAVALVTVLLAGMEAELLGLLPPSDPNEARSIVALRIFAYGSMLINLAGTLACVLMIDSLSDLPTSARQVCMADPQSLPRLVFTKQAKIPQELLYSRNERTLLYTFGLEVPWGFFNFFWAWAFPVGVCGIVVQIMLYVYIMESKVVAGILTPLGVVVLVPLVAGFVQTRRG